MTPQEFKEERQRLKISQAAMAKRIGVSLQAVYYYETGRRKVPQPVALLLDSQRIYHRLLAEKGSEK
jgi:DNA-binding transcriptional regulator YiaG